MRKICDAACQENSQRRHHVCDFVPALRQPSRKWQARDDEKVGQHGQQLFLEGGVGGKTVESVPSMGDIATPGRLTTSDSDKIATSVARGRGDFPVIIFMTAK